MYGRGSVIPLTSALNNGRAGPKTNMASDRASQLLVFKGFVSTYLCCLRTYPPIRWLHGVFGWSATVIRLRGQQIGSSNLPYSIQHTEIFL